MVTGGWQYAAAHAPAGGAVSDQTAIPAPGCRWCGAPATDVLVIEKAKFRNHNGVKVEAKAAITAPVCAAHYRSIERTGEDE